MTAVNVHISPVRCLLSGLDSRLRSRARSRDAEARLVVADFDSADAATNFSALRPSRATTCGRPQGTCSAVYEILQKLDSGLWRYPVGVEVAREKCKVNCRLWYVLTCGGIVWASMEHPRFERYMAETHWGLAGLAALTQPTAAPRSGLIRPAPMWGATRQNLSSVDPLRAVKTCVRSPVRGSALDGYVQAIPVTLWSSPETTFQTSCILRSAASP